MTVVGSSPVEWANARLGCVLFEEPDDPAPVDGYRIVVDAAGLEFDYRLDDEGVFRLCGEPIETVTDAHDDGDDHGEPEHLDEESS